MDINIEEEKINVPNENRKIPEKTQRKKPLTCPSKTSSFFVTINSNHCVNTSSELENNQVKEKFHSALNEFMKNLHEFTSFKTSKLGVSYGYGENDTKEILWQKDRILEHKCLYVLEISPSGRLHAHVLWYLRKKGVDTQLKLAEIRSFFNEKMGKNCHINYKLEAKKHSSLEEYMSKNPLI